MSFFEAVIKALIFIGLMALVYFIVVWALGAFGVAMPPHVLQIIGVIFVLVCILILARLFYPWVGVNWFGPRSNRDRP